MKRTAFSAVCLIMMVGGANGQEFGRFPENPHGEFINGPDRTYFRLDKPFRYLDPNGLEWVAPAGEATDGASIPWEFWTFVGDTYSGLYLNAAIIHDYYSCSKAREYYSTQNTFWLGMRSLGISETKANIFWVAVRFFGLDYWSVDPSVKPPSPCNKGPAGPKEALNDVNEQTRVIALAKFAAMVRTLETTDGRVLDIVDDQPIAPNTERGNEYLEYLRTAMKKDFDVPRETLGLFSVVSDAELAARNPAGTISPWIEGQVPALDKYMAQAALKYPPPLKLESGDYAAFVAGPRDLKLNDFAAAFRLPVNEK